jgi:hypothetical protein
MWPIASIRRIDFPEIAKQQLKEVKFNPQDEVKLDYDNPPLVPGELYLGKKVSGELKLFYIPSKLIEEEKDYYLWAIFYKIIPRHSIPTMEYSGSKSKATRMGFTSMDHYVDNMEQHYPYQSYDELKNIIVDTWIEDNIPLITQKIEKSYPWYISWSEIRKLKSPIKFMNWMKERPISPKEEPKITKEEPKESWVNFANWLDNWETWE